MQRTMIRTRKPAPKPASSPNKEPKNIPKTIAPAATAKKIITKSIIAARNLIQKPLKGVGCVPIN